MAIDYFWVLTTVAQLKVFKGRIFASFFLFFFFFSFFSPYSLLSHPNSYVFEKRSPCPLEKSMRKRTQSDAGKDWVPFSKDRIPCSVLFLLAKRTQSDASKELRREIHDEENPVQHRWRAHMWSSASLCVFYGWWYGCNIEMVRSNVGHANSTHMEDYWNDALRKKSYTFWAFNGWLL